MNCPTEDRQTHRFVLLSFVLPTVIRYRFFSVELITIINSSECLYYAPTVLYYWAFLLEPPP